jgi:RimJ/RimL family protein N-acetyltransferase
LHLDGHVVLLGRGSPRNHIAMTSLQLPLESDHLVYRLFERGDCDSLARYHTLPCVQRYVEKPASTIKDVARSLETMRHQVSLQRPGDAIALAVVRKGDHVLVGQTSLYWSDATAGQGEVRFAIDPAHSGKGYMTEALTTLFDAAFQHFGFHRLFARCDGRSHHSAKLLQRLGMRLEAHFREHKLFQGEWDEELHFAILDREWRRSSKVRELSVRGRVA